MSLLTYTGHCHGCCDSVKCSTAPVGGKHSCDDSSSQVTNHKQHAEDEILQPNNKDKGTPFMQGVNNERWGEAAGNA